MSEQVDHPILFAGISWKRMGVNSNPQLRGDIVVGSAPFCT